MKYTDLHAHIEGTVSAKTLLKLIKKYWRRDEIFPDYFSPYQREILDNVYEKLKANASNDEMEQYIADKLVLKEPSGSLMDFIIRLPTKFLKYYVRETSDLEYLIDSTLAQYDDKYEKIEIIFCPVAFANQWLSDDDIVRVISEFWQKHPNKERFSFLLSLRRTEEEMSVTYANKVVSIFSQYADKGIPKLDICADENALSYMDLKEQLDILSQGKQELTLHLGETTDRDMDFILDNYPNVKQFNHGVQAAFDDKLLSKIKNNDVLLTVCPLSNIYTHVFDEAKLFEAIKKIKEAGIRYTICSDDATIIHGDVDASYKYLEEKAPELLPEG